jgi:hypothetical protein
MPNPDELFAIVPCSHGHVPEDAIITGNLSQVTEYIPQSVAREEAEQRLAQAKEEAAATERIQAEARACAAQMLADSVARLNERVDAFVERKQEREREDAAREAEAEAKAVEAMLDALPDPDDPDAMGDDGELQAVHEPPDPEKHNPEHRNEAATGSMPPELDAGAPPEAGQYVPTTPPESPYRDPASIGGP